MATNTSRLGLLKKDTATDGNDTFNIKTMLNDNWDKIDAKVATLGADGKVPAEQLSIAAPVDASMTQKGVVMLEDSVTSASVTKAATPKSVKTVNDALAAHKTDYAKLSTDVGTLKKLSKVRSNKDSNGIFTTVTYKRKSDGTIYAKSVLSGGTSPNYTTKTETFYGTDGTTVIETNVYNVSYDSDGDWIGEL